MSNSICNRKPDSLATEVGFILVDKSEINSNEKIKNHPMGFDSSSNFKT